MTVDQLAADIAELGPDHADALHELQMIRKARRGTGKYGPLSLEADQRDFMAEALEESLDREWYLLFEIVKLRRENARLTRALLPVPVYSCEIGGER